LQTKRKNCHPSSAKLYGKIRKGKNGKILSAAQKGETTPRRAWLSFSGTPWAGLGEKHKGCAGKEGKKGKTIPASADGLEKKKESRNQRTQAEEEGKSKSLLIWGMGEKRKREIINLLILRRGD